jgi:hypothetical protein
MKMPRLVIEELHQYGRVWSDGFEGVENLIKFFLSKHFCMYTYSSYWFDFTIFLIVSRF